jgi:hypothetical protein
LTKLLQSKIVESFENAKPFGAVARPIEGLNADCQLLIDIRAFQISPSPRLEAQVEFSAKILGHGGKIVGTRIFREQGDRLVFYVKLDCSTARWRGGPTSTARDPRHKAEQPCRLQQLEFQLMQCA